MQLHREVPGKRACDATPELSIVLKYRRRDQIWYAQLIESGTTWLLTIISYVQKGILNKLAYLIH